MRCLYPNDKNVGCLARGCMDFTECTIRNLIKSKAFHLINDAKFNFGISCERIDEALKTEKLEK